MNDEMFRIRLRDILRHTSEPVSMYEVAKKLGLNVDDFLRLVVPIKDEFMAKYKQNFKKMIEPGNKNFFDSFFKLDIIDLGFLVQHNIKEIADSLKDKHNTMGHQMFYDSWILYRGY